MCFHNTISPTIWQQINCQVTLSPPGGVSPNDNKNDNGTPRDGSSSDHLEDTKKEIKRLLARLLLESEKGNGKRMKTSIQENNAHYCVKLEKLQGKVEGKVVTPKATKVAASDTDRTKVAGAKELVLEAKDLRLNHTLMHHRSMMMKELLSTSKTMIANSSEKVKKNLERKMSGLNRNLMDESVSSFLALATITTVQEWIYYTRSEQQQ